MRYKELELRVKNLELRVKNLEIEIEKMKNPPKFENGDFVIFKAFLDGSSNDFRNKKGIVINKKWIDIYFLPIRINSGWQYEVFTEDKFTITIQEYDLELDKSKNNSK